MPRMTRLKKRSCSRRRGWLVSVLTIFVVLVGVIGTGQAQETPGVVEALRAEIVPAAGTETSYGIALSLSNTQQLIDWFYSIPLLPEEEAIMQQALETIPAPCCDDNSAATCCCECNLARSVWGLSAYLIHEKGCGVEETREAALQWLQFARGDYYIAAALKVNGYFPQDYNLTTYGSCYRGMCEFPLTQGGCAGMEALVEPDLPVGEAVLTSDEENECLIDEELPAELGEAKIPAFGLITPSEAAGLIETNLGNPAFVLLDVRTPEEFAGGHIGGAVNLDYKSPNFREGLEQLDRSPIYLVYCRSAVRSGRAVAVMEELGFTGVYDMAGGILQWQEEDFEVSR